MQAKFSVFRFPFVQNSLLFLLSFLVSSQGSFLFGNSHEKQGRELCKTDKKQIIPVVFLISFLHF